MTFLPACSSSHPKLKDHFPRVLGVTPFFLSVCQTLMNIQIPYFNKTSEHSFEGKITFACLPSLNYSPVCHNLI